MRQAIRIRKSNVGSNQENQSSLGAIFLCRLDRIYVIPSSTFSLRWSRRMGNGPEVVLRGITEVIGLQCRNRPGLPSGGFCPDLKTVGVI